MPCTDRAAARSSLRWSRSRCCRPASPTTTAPTAAEVSAWVNSGLNLLALEVTFLAGNEFFVDG